MSNRNDFSLQTKDRRNFLKAALKTGITAGLGLSSFSLWAGKPFFNSVKNSVFKLNTSPSITLCGANSTLGHRLLQKEFPSPQTTLKTQVIIIGSGVAGLSAARHLYKNKVHDFMMVELEPSIGGNSSWGENAISRFPWGGHYLPIPGLEQKFLFEFLQESNVITGFNSDGLPIYNELYLCHDLKERLFINGKWQEGLIPKVGILKKDKDQIAHFFELMDQYKYKRGNDDLPFFNIPLEEGSQDPKLLWLDGITMKEFMLQQGLDSSYLHWYVNYCCRDDYGVGIDAISAWAGLHYFASRRAKAANAESDAILTWPEGNGFLVEKMSQSFRSNIKTNMLAYEFGAIPSEKPKTKNEFYVNCYSADQGKTIKIIAETVIVACPRFVAKHLAAKTFSLEFSGIEQLSYSPWLVANISVKEVPGVRSTDLAWDNVSYYSKSLGYIDARHQSLSAVRGNTVLTYYLPLDDEKPAIARKKALDQPMDVWKKMIVDDLEKMHPGIFQAIEHIDLWIWGHGMIRPVPNFIWEQRPKYLHRTMKGIFFAHSDMSGISIFEEAFWQGLMTAKAVLKYLK